MSLEIPKGELIACSDLFRGTLEKNNVSIVKEPEVARALAGHVLERILPDLGYMYTRDVRVASEATIQLHGGESRTFPSAEFQARFSGICVREAVIDEDLPGFGVIRREIDEIFFEFTQRVVDPDPVDLGYSDVIVVGLSEIDSLTRIGT